MGQLLWIGCLKCLVGPSGLGCGRPSRQVSMISKSFCPSKSRKEPMSGFGLMLCVVVPYGMISPIFFVQPCARRGLSLSISFEGVGWNLKLHIPLNDWELEQVVDHMSQLDRAMLGNPDDDDSRWWAFEPSGIFLVKSCFFSLVPQIDCGFPIKTICKSNLPSKARFFFWLVYWGHAPQWTT